MCALIPRMGVLVDYSQQRSGLSSWLVKGIITVTLTDVNQERQLRQARQGFMGEQSKFQRIGKG